MDDWSVLPIQLLVSFFGGYLTWRSARGYLKRRKKGTGQLPIDRVWRRFALFFALFISLAVLIVLLVEVGVALLVLDVLFVALGSSMLGMMVCGFLVGWYAWDDTSDDGSKEGAGRT
jgi:TRAP-type C4-dicarboxylate transport system permease small subunit